MNILSFIWQLPQNLIGKYIIENNKLTSTKKVICEDDRVVKVYFCKDVCLDSFAWGNYIILNDKYKNKNILKLVNHEHLYNKLSILFSWLYIPIIAVPLIIYRVVNK